MRSQFAVTWWGHSSVTVELGRVRIGTDPLLVDRLGHLRRYAPAPTAQATDLDLVLVSHLHADHLHIQSLRRIAARATIVVPRGAASMLKGLSSRKVIEVMPGDQIELAGVTIDVLTAHHDDRRHPMSGRRAPALGFRVHDDAHSFWYPGDTGPDPIMRDVASVDLALVPIGGWGPTLGDKHLGPEQATTAVELVGARWALPVHYGTFWPVGLRHVNRANHRRLFVTPGPRFGAAMAASSLDTVALLPSHGERLILEPSDEV